MNKQIKKLIVVVLLVACVALVVFNVACKKEQDNYAPMIDNAREYVGVSISPEKKNIANYCRIENYYTSAEYKVIRVIAERGYAGEIELLVLLEGTTLKKTKVIKSDETPGHGTKCFEDKFLEQFYEKDLSTIEPLIGKEEKNESGDILYVTGATKTSRAIISAINAVILFIKSL
jgi:Na+-translocating ferredoxin:NAD+ oxidoreductase RnfG subunit